MNAIAAAGAGFLVAVLWFDLMFDVQVRRHGGEVLPDEVLGSISAYYRRVTTDAQPMSRLVTFAGVVTVLALAAQAALGREPAWAAWLSLALALAGLGLAVARTVRNAARLGRRGDPAQVQSRLARLIYRDHLFCLATMTAVMGLQVRLAG